MFDAEAIIKSTIGKLHGYYWWLAQSLYFGGTSDDQIQPIIGSPIREELLLLVRVANGEIERATADEMTVGEVGETCQHVCETLFTAPGGRYSYHIPDEFWREPLGQVISHCLLWQRGDDLITHSQAAEMLYQDASEKSLNRLRRVIEKGQLRAYTDPREPNPQKAGRVSRQEVEGLK